LEFCEKCGKLKTKTSVGVKCEKCDDLSQIPKNKPTENKIGILSDDSFPFELNVSYKAPDIRNTLDCDRQSGISYNKKYNFITLLRYAHKLEPNSSNPYLDFYDSETQQYHYVGKGATGNQTIATGVNEKLAHATETGTKIHLFWQKYPNSDHQYVGEMKLLGHEPKTQPDKDSNDRTVYVFTLKTT